MVDDGQQCSELLEGFDVSQVSGLQMESAIDQDGEANEPVCTPQRLLPIRIGGQPLRRRH